MIDIKKTRKRIFTFVIILLFVFLIGIQGNTALEEEKKEEKESKVVTHPTFVDEVVVQGEIVQETAAVNLITAEEIKRKGVKTVAEALELVPGTHIRVGGKGEAYIRIRGFRQREVALLVDGIPIYSPYDGQLDLSSLPVDAIERIEVVKGAASVLYGPNAMGGVVNIITKKSDGSRDYMLSSEYGSGDSLQLRGTMQGAVKKMRYLVVGAYQAQDEYPLANDYGSFANQESTQRENSDKQGWSGKVSLGWDVGKTGSAAVNFSHVDQERGLPHHESDPKAKFWRFSDWRHGILDFVFNNTIGPMSFKSKFYYEYLENVLQSYDDSSYTTQDGKNAFTDSLKDRGFGGDMFFRLTPNKAHLFKMALRFKQDIHRQQSAVDDPWREYKMNTLSLPIEGEWLPSKFFNFTYGASLDMMFFNTEDVGGGNSHTTNAFNPQVATLFNVSDSLKFRISASRKTRFPTLKELFSTQSGNPELEPMKANILEGGFDYRVWQNVSFSATVFYNDIKGLINRTSKYDPYINIDHAVFKGFELEADWRFYAGSGISLAYTRLQAEDKTNGTNQYIEHRPKHKFDFNFNFKLPFQSRFDFFGSYVSSQFYYDDDEECKLDPYFLVDLKLSKDLGDHVHLFLRIRNLFDANYYESEGYPREGRMIFAGFRFGFK
jgi:outer membrane cobalamin receptor